MRNYFSASLKIEIIKKVLVDKQTVYSVCRQYGISKVSFYKWLVLYNNGRKNRQETLKNKFRIGFGHPKALPYRKHQLILSTIHKNPDLSCRMLAEQLSISHHAVQNVLVRYGLSLFADRRQFASRPFWKRESADRRMAMMKMLETGWKVGEICKHFRISAPTFNKWRRIYLQSGEKSVKDLADRYISGPIHHKTLRPEVEKAVLDTVLSNPLLSVHQIHRKLALAVGHHGIQNLFSRENLNTLAKRLEYAAGFIVRPIVKVAPLYRPELPVYRWRQLFAPFVTVPKLLFTDPRHGIPALFVLSTPFLALFFFIHTVSSSAPGTSVVGLAFASIALFIGLFFFVYSMSYYISIFMVLKVAQAGGGSSTPGESGPTPGVSLA